MRAGLYAGVGDDADGRWLWFGSLGDDITEAHLTERIEGVGGYVAKGGFSVHRLGTGAWVHFTAAPAAQACLSALNGATLVGSQPCAMRVRYGASSEDTSKPPAVTYLKRSLDHQAAQSSWSSTSTAALGTCQSSAKACIASLDVSSSPVKRVKALDALPSVSATKADRCSHATSSVGASPGLASVGGRTGNEGSGPSGRDSAWDDRPGSNADVLRLALRCVD